MDQEIAQKMRSKLKLGYMNYKGYETKGFDGAKIELIDEPTKKTTHTITTEVITVKHKFPMDMDMNAYPETRDMFDENSIDFDQRFEQTNLEDNFEQNTFEQPIFAELG